MAFHNMHCQVHDVSYDSDMDCPDCVAASVRVVPLEDTNADPFGTMSGKREVTILANNRQVGGDHYAGEYQHWDWVADMGLDYHRGNATKYVARAFKKNGKQDLEKALHYIDKREELLAARNGRASKDDSVNFDALLTFCTSNDLSTRQAHALSMICHDKAAAARTTIAALIAELP